MFDILTFIDSKDIRNHNVNTQFFPMEQAVLIYLSLHTTVEQKIAAWKWLYKNYSEKDFQKTRLPREDEDVSYRAIMHDTCLAYEEALADRTNTSDFIFEVIIRPLRVQNDPCYHTHFLSYDAAYYHLKRAKETNIFEPMKNDILYAEIVVRKLNEPLDEVKEIFCFDSELNMFNIRGVDHGLEDFFVYVPLPFKKGDILRTVDLDKTYYGIMYYDPTEDEYEELIKSGSSIQMVVELYEFFKKDKWMFGRDSLPFLHLEKCPDHELPKEQENLRLVKDEPSGEALVRFSHFGENASASYDVLTNYKIETGEISVGQFNYRDWRSYNENHFDYIEKKRFLSALIDYVDSRDNCESDDEDEAFTETQQEPKYTSELFSRAEPFLAHKLDVLDDIAMYEKLANDYVKKIKKSKKNEQEHQALKDEFDCLLALREEKSEEFRQAAAAIEKRYAEIETITDDEEKSMVLKDFLKEIRYKKEQNEIFLKMASRLEELKAKVE